MEKIKKSCREIRIKKLIILAKELQHFISIESNEYCDTIIFKKMIYSLEMKLLKRFNDVMICTARENIISITIYK